MAAPVDLAHAADAGDAGWILFDGRALRDEGMDGTAHVLMVATQKARPLRPGEDAAMETGQGDPFGTAPALFAREVTKGPRRSPDKSLLTHKIALSFPDSSR